MARVIVSTAHRRRATTAVVWGATLLGLALRLYQLSRPGFLLGVTEYDDGAYFGSALRLVHGVLPYRDFVLVQPPGITLLMAPVALLAGGIGTAKALAVGRVLTVCAGAGGIAVGGSLVRHRGPLAATITCGIIAVHPDAVASAHTVLLEPWLVLCCLLGLRLVFDGDSLVREVAGWRSRAVWGGIAFGAAGAIKVWAILPVIVVAALWLPVCRRFLSGVALGFAVPVLPFVVLAPRRFVDSVIVGQLSRVDATRVPLWTRLASLAGVPPVAAALAIALVVLAIRRRPTALEWFAMVTAALVVGAFCWPDDYYYHYAGFFAPFLALAIALPVTATAQWRLTGIVAVAIALAAAGQARTETGLRAADPAAIAQRLIPPGACVLTDEVSLTIAADRFTSAVPGCSPMVDGVGTDYALSLGRNGITGAGAVPAVQSTWLSAFEHAGYVWLSSAADRRIPWTPAITGYFTHHFTAVPAPALTGRLYVRSRLRGGRQPPASHSMASAEGIEPSGRGFEDRAAFQSPPTR